MEELRKGKALPGDWRARRSEEVSEAFNGQYIDYQYIFVEFFVTHLADVGRAFRGDLQAMIVLAHIGQQSLAAVREAHASGRDHRTLPDTRTRTSASRISDVTGIPRQTVRRKLAALEERGWVLRNTDGTYSLLWGDGRSPAQRDLYDIDRRSLQRVARLFVDLEALVSKNDPNVPGSDEA